MLWTVVDELRAQPTFATPWVNGHAPLLAGPGLRIQVQWLALDASVASAANCGFLLMQSEGDV